MPFFSLSNEGNEFIHMAGTFGLKCCVIAFFEGGQVAFGIAKEMQHGSIFI